MVILRSPSDYEGNLSSNDKRALGSPSDGTTTPGFKPVSPDFKRVSAPIAHNKTLWSHARIARPTHATRVKN